MTQASAKTFEARQFDSLQAHSGGSGVEETASNLFSTLDSNKYSIRTVVYTLVKLNMVVPIKYLEWSSGVGVGVCVRGQGSGVQMPKPDAISH